MKPERWSQVRALFERAAAMPPAERKRLLDESTGGDAELCAEVERLLEAITDNPAFLQSPDRALVARSLESDGELGTTGLGSNGHALIELEPGVRLGSYRIVRRLGAGGMGTVYEAVQTRPERTVALKVLRDPLAGPEARRRFLVEAELLGQLHHPHIATVFEMGEQLLPSETGEDRLVPFFALELVPGAKDLVSYAREAQLSLRERIELFREFCAAIHHAHLSGVLHRDLKPDNLLVDETGRPKVIDYGVARALDPALTPAGLESLGEQMVGTLQYMSPEQLARGSAALDVRADVYALGLVLFELIAGERPYRLSNRPLAEVLEVVCHQPVPPPSRHAPSLPRELDWITLRALAKEPSERYESAAELARDLGRHLAGEAVQSAPPSAVYRARKFVSRNRYAVGTAVLIAASLAFGLISRQLALAAAQEDRDRANRSAEQLRIETDRKQVALSELELANRELQLAGARVELELGRQRAVTAALRDMLGAVDPDEDGYQVTLFALLERGRPRLDGMADDPAAHATLACFYAEAYRDLGQLETAEELYLEALQALETVAGQALDESAATAELGVAARVQLAQLRILQLRFDEAGELLDAAEARDLGGAGSGVSSPKTGLGIAMGRSQIAEGLGDLAAADALLVDALARWDADLPVGDEAALLVRSRRGILLLQLNRPGEARDVLEAVWEEALASLGEEHSTSLTIGNRLSQVLHATGSPAAAIELQTLVTEATVRVYGAHSPSYVNAQSALLIAHLGVGDYEGAQAAGERALDALDLAAFEDPDLEVVLRSNYATALLRSNLVDEAVPQLEDARRLLEASGQTVGPRMFDVLLILAEAQLRTGDGELAEVTYEQLLFVGREAFGPESWQAHLAGSRLGLQLLLNGDIDEGIDLMNASQAGLRAVGSEVATQQARRIEHTLSQVVLMLRAAEQAEDNREHERALVELLEAWGVRAP